MLPKFDPFEEQIKLINDPIREIDDDAKFHCLYTTVLDGHFPSPEHTAFAFSFLALDLPIRDTTQTIGEILLQRGSDGAVDLESQRGGLGTPASTLNNIAHSSRWEGFKFFGVPPGASQPVSRLVANRVVELLTGASTAFGKFSLPTLLDPKLRERIDALVPTYIEGGRILEVVGGPIFTLQASGNVENDSPPLTLAAAGSTTFNLKLDPLPSEQIEGKPRLFARVFGPNGETMDGVAVIGDIQDPTKATLVVDSAVQGDVVVSALYFSKGGNVVLSDSVLVTSRPPGAMLTEIELEPQSISLNRDDAIPIKIWGKYDNGTRSLLFIAPTSDLQIVSSAPTIASVDDDNILTANSPGIVNITATYKGLTAQGTVTSTAPSANANLTSLVPSAGTLTPVFDSATTGYTAGVSNAIASVSVTPTATDINATVKVNGTIVTSGSASGPISLNVGPNVITIVVTAQDGITSKVYLLTANRSEGFPLRASLYHPKAAPEWQAQHGYSIAANASYIVAGARQGGVSFCGSAAVFNAQTGAVIATLPNPAPQLDYRANYGTSVALSGSRVAIGVPGSGGSSAGPNRVYVFDLDSANPMVPVFTITNPSGSNTDLFGAAVALSGNYLVVGAPAVESNTGSAYVYDLGGATPTAPLWTLRDPLPAADEWFGSSVAVSDRYVIVGSPNDQGGAGRVFVYELASATPTLPAVTLASPTPAHLFGQDIAISGSRLIVGVPGANGGGTLAGAAYVFDLESAAPNAPLVTFNNPHPATSDLFGDSVAISGNRVIVGAYWDDAGAFDGGSAYVYDLSGVVPTVPIATLNNPTPADDDWFGHAVAITGDRAVVGAPKETLNNEQVAVERSVTHFSARQMPVSLGRNANPAEPLGMKSGFAQMPFHTGK